MSDFVWAGRVVRLCAAALVLASSGCGSGRDGAGDLLGDLLEVMPAAVVDAHLYFTDLRGGAGGFGSALPLAAVAPFGVDPDELEAVLESGGDPTTVLAGTVDPSTVADAAADLGYAVEQDGGWTVFTQDAAASRGSGLLSAVPAGAARRGVLVIGGPPAVDRVVAGDAAAIDVGWVARIVSGLDDGSTSVALAPPVEPDQAARAADGDVDRLLRAERVTRRLVAYEGLALAWRPDPEDDMNGQVLLAVPDGVDGREQAAALAMRAATAPVVGERRRPMADVLDGGPPRFLDDARVVTLPVRWVAFDPARLRADLEAGNLLFLVPGPD